MDGSGLIIPPYPRRPQRDLSLPAFVMGVATNVLATVPDYFFEERLVQRRFYGQDTLVVSDPAGIREVLIEKASLYERPGPFRRPLRPIAGEGVLLAEGEAWKAQRRMLAPLFTPAAIERLIPHYQAAAARMLTGFEGRSASRLGEDFQAAALDAVLQSLFSLPDDARRFDFARSVEAYISGPGQPSMVDALSRREDDFRALGFGRRRFGRLWRAKVEVLIEERLAKGEPDDRPGDLLDRLLAARDPETGEGLTRARVRDEASTLLAAGFETTARLLGWAAYLLALDPATQDAIRAEVRMAPAGTAASLADLSRWPRLRAALFETLRLYPPAFAVVRQATSAHRILDREVRQGALVWISLWVLHRHRAFWDHPDAFFPERFVGEKAPWSQGGPFMPFGSGPRVCIGAAFAIAEAQILMASLVGRYRFWLAEDRPVMPVGGVTIRPDHQPLFRLEPLD